VSAAADLYRALVLEHGKRPRNVGALPDATHAADGDNPLCGDAVHVELAVAGSVVVAVRFRGESCLLATASASLMTEHVGGMSREDARDAIAAVEDVCARGVAPSDDVPGGLRDTLGAFADVHRHPVRVACAMLPWRTLARALGD
jgi:nitrogen fixation NifU-like protein